MPLSDADLANLAPATAPTGGLSDADLAALPVVSRAGVAAPTAYDPSAGGGELQIGPIHTGVQMPQWLTRTLAGAGEGISNVATGIKLRGSQLIDAIDPPQQNLSGLITGQAPQSRADKVRADIAEQRRLDAPLEATTSGKVGNMVGTGVAMAPAALIPGAGTALGATMIGAGTGYLQPSLSGSETLANTGVGAAGGLAGNMAGKLVTALGSKARIAPPTEITIPGSAAEEAAQAAGGLVHTPLNPAPGTVQGNLTAAQQALLSDADRLGWKLTPGQKTGSVPLQQIEAHLESQPGSSGPFNAARTNNTQILNKAAATSIGVPEAADMSQATLQEADKRIGATFNRARTLGPVALDQDAALNGLAKIESQAESTPHSPIADHPAIKDYLRLASNGEASGNELVSLRTRLGNDAKSAFGGQNPDHATGKALMGVQDLVDQHLADGATAAGQPDLTSALTDARGNYRNLMLLTARNNITNPSSGNVNGNALASALMSKDKGGFTFGRNTGDLYTAARLSQAFKGSIGDSGTATRLGDGNIASKAAYWLGSQAYMNPIVNNVARGVAIPSKTVAALLTRNPVSGPMLSPTGAALGGAATALQYSPLAPAQGQQ